MVVLPHLCVSWVTVMELWLVAPGLHEDGHRDLLVAALRGAAVVEVHDAFRGVDTGHHHRVVGADLALDRLVPDRLGVEADDDRVAATQQLLEQTPYPWRYPSSRLCPRRCW